MIEGPGTPSSPRGPGKGFSPQRILEQLRAQAEAAWRLMSPVTQAAGGMGDVLLWRLHLAERLFWIALAGLVVYLASDLLFGNRRPPVLATYGLQVVPAGEGVGLGPDRLKPLEEYRQVIVSRNPFAASGPVVQQDAQSRIEAATGSLIVVGINRGRKPEALIEDTQAKRTHVVKIGDEINGLTVKSIGANGVVVTDGTDDAVLQ